MKKKSPSNLMVHDLCDAEALGTPLQCLKHQHILLDFLLRSDVKTSEPSLSTKFRVTPTPQQATMLVRRILALGEVLCEPFESVPFCCSLPLTPQ